MTLSNCDSKDSAQPVQTPASRARRYFNILAAIVLSIFGFLLTMAGYRYHRQMSFMNRVFEGHGRVMTDHSGPNWLRQRIGDDRTKAFENIETVSIYKKMSDADLAFIASHNVPNVEISSDRQLTRKLAEQLATNPRLKRVVIYSRRESISQDFLEAISQSGSLESISFSVNRLDGNALQPLTGMKSLNDVEMSFDVKLATNLNVLEQLPGLTRLSISGSRTDRTHWDQIAALNRENLKLTISHLNDEQLLQLSSMTRVESLVLKDFTLTEEGLTALENIQGLRSLMLSGNLSNRELQSLENLNGLVSLELAGGEFTDSGLSSLYGLKNLKKLKISGSQVTQTGIRDLQSHLPDTEITYSRYVNWRE